MYVIVYLSVDSNGIKSKKNRSQHKARPEPKVRKINSLMDTKCMFNP